MKKILPLIKANVADPSRDIFTLECLNDIVYNFEGPINISTRSTGVTVDIGTLDSVELKDSTLYGNVTSLNDIEDHELNMMGLIDLASVTFQCDRCHKLMVSTTPTCGCGGFIEIKQRTITKFKLTGVLLNK